jgi:hypothetical protein
MTNDRDRLERELRDHFAAERVQDAARSPGYAAVRAGRSRPERPRIWLPVLVGALAVVVLVGTYLWRPRSGLPPGIDLKAVEWTSPTDFLLEIAGSEFLEQVPEIGPTAGWPSIDLPSAGAARTEMRRNEL